MLAIEMSQTARRFRALFKCPNSKSHPIWNMSSISPIWLRTCIGAPASDVNRLVETPGRKCPNSDGPSISPATISPTARGWPIRARRASRQPGREDDDDQLDEDGDEQVFGLVDRQYCFPHCFL